MKRIVYFLFFLGAIFTLVAYQAGESAAQIIGNYIPVDMDYAVKHIQAAGIFSILNYLLGAFAVLGLWANLKQKNFSKYILFGVVLYSLIVLSFGIATAKAGGEVRHTEIRAEQPEQTDMIIEEKNVVPEVEKAIVDTIASTVVD